MHPATYRIIVDGALSDAEVQELVGLRVVERTEQTTLLEGTLRDQPALLGVVARLEELGCRVHDLQPMDTVVGAGGRP